MNKFGDEAVFIAGGYRINEDVPGSQVFLREHFAFDMSSNFKGFDYYDFPFGNSLLTHFVIDDRVYVLSMDREKKFAEFQWGVLWNNKNSFPGEFLGRYVSFSIGSKGYVLVESSGRAASTRDFYEYEPQTDSWTKKADFPGRDRFNGIAFSVDGKGYYGAGEAKDAIEGLKDLWQYNPEEDKWEKFADFPGSANVKVIANTIGDKVYMGLGFRIENSSVGAKQYTRAYDYWEFSPKGNNP
jgi:N-acetylneuraminic acid mutarotase